MSERGDSLCTSAFTIGEILTGVFKRGAAERYARIRADNRVSPADGIHLASAGQGGVDLFLTNDQRLKGLSVPGIQFIAGMDVNLF